MNRSTSRYANIATLCEFIFLFLFMIGTAARVAEPGQVFFPAEK